MTIKFLGDTEAELLPQVSKLLTEAALALDEFLVDLNGLGAFPSMRRPNVVWVGLRTDAALADFVEQWDEKLAPLGFPREKRRFTPHLTVARIKGPPPPELATFVAHNAHTDYGSHIVESMELYQSELTAEGARYTVMATAQLRS